MTNIPITTALKLLRFNLPDPEIASILQTTLDELDRLYQVEEIAKQMAALGKDNLIDDELIARLEKLAGQ